MQPPRHIVEEIKRYDPFLNLRWSKEKRTFILERRIDGKMVHKNLVGKLIPKPVRYRRDGDGVREIMLPENSDRYIHYHRKTLPIAFVRTLDRRLFWWLFAHDSYLVGRKRLVNKIEDQERKVEEQREARNSDDMIHMGGEAYDHMKRISGERISMR